MNQFEWQLRLSGPAETRLLGQVLALKLRPGDIAVLSGDLGAGKSTLARAMVRAFQDDPVHEVPSPTFSLMQVYETPRFEVRHFDFYRLGSSYELAELGFFDGLNEVVSLVEWPERAGDELPHDHIEVSLSEVADNEDERLVRVCCGEGSLERLGRAQEIWDFVKQWALLNDVSVDDVDLAYLQGDASARSYAHVRSPACPAILMDSSLQPDGPAIRDGLPYSRIAHLAEDIQPFIAIGAWLKDCGCSVPETLLVNRDKGLAMIEDLGNKVFGDLISAGEHILPLYRDACDVLLHLRAAALPSNVAGHGCAHRLPPFDEATLAIETELLLDWYFPSVTGAEADAAIRTSFQAAWRAQFARLQKAGKGIVLRDFHSPNLLRLDERNGIRRVGLIDYQDALIGHPAYDLVSLLQDARLDVPETIEAELLHYYCDQARNDDPSFDKDEFLWAYRLLGAQRNTKILGIFTRLSQRDGKHLYLRHIPRVAGYLRRNLVSDELAGLRGWFTAHLPSIVA